MLNTPLHNNRTKQRAYTDNRQHRAPTLKKNNNMQTMLFKLTCLRHFCDNFF